jgi:hypothetical protein
MCLRNRVHSSTNAFLRPLIVVDEEDEEDIAAGNEEAGGEIMSLWQESDDKR